MNLFNSSIQFGILYTCTSEWINEMGYKWKVGEEVVTVSAKEYSIVVRTKHSAQCFEINLEKFNNHFSIK